MCLSTQSFCLFQFVTFSCSKYLRSVTIIILNNGVQAAVSTPTGTVFSLFFLIWRPTISPWRCKNSADQIAFMA